MPDVVTCYVALPPVASDDGDPQKPSPPIWRVRDPLVRSCPMRGGVPTMLIGDDGLEKTDAQVQTVGCHEQRNE